MKKTVNVMLTAAVLVLPAAFLNATVNQGTWEIGFSGAYSSLDVGPDDVELLQADATVGFFVTNGLQISGSIGYLDADLDTFEFEALTLGAGADYHFMTRSPFVPYVGGGLRWVDVDVDGLGSDDDWAWEVRAGAKQFITRNVAIKYQAAYFEFDDLDLDGFNLSVGLSFFF